MSITNGIFTLTGATVVATAVAYTPPGGSPLTGNLYSFDSSGSIVYSTSLSTNKAFILAVTGGNTGSNGANGTGYGGNGGAGGAYLFTDLHDTNYVAQNIDYNIVVGGPGAGTTLNGYSITSLNGTLGGAGGAGGNSGDPAGGNGDAPVSVTIGSTTYYFSGGGGGGGMLGEPGGNGGNGGDGGSPGSNSGSGIIGANGSGGSIGGAGGAGAGNQGAGGGGGGGGGGYGGGGGGGATSNGAGGAGAPGIVLLFIVSQAVLPLCFLRGSKILCLKDGEEQYTAIEEMRVGMEVKTLKGTYVKVHTIGKTMFNNPDNADRGPNRLFKLSRENYPELTEDLIITGCHSRLVVKLEPKQKARHLQLMKSLYMTTDMFRLMAFIDEKAEPYINPGSHEIWHFALENEVEVCNYGVYANGGLLVETASIKNMKERSGLALIE